jgi:hypothetical protein
MSFLQPNWKKRAEQDVKVFRGRGRKKEAGGKNGPKNVYTCE